MNIEEATINEILKEEKEQLWEMANISQRESGLSTVIHSLWNCFNTQPHGGRVKVETPEGRIPVQLLPNVEIPKSVNKNKYKDTTLQLVQEAIPYITKYRDTFVAHAKGEIDDALLHDVLQNRLTLQQAKKEYKK